MATGGLFEALRPRIDAMIATDRVPLAPFPATSARLSQTISKVNYRQDELVAIIEVDQVMVASLLRYVNSSAMRGAREITSVREAVQRAGADELLSLAFSAGLGASVSSGGPLQNLRYEVWRTATFSAELARRLAPRREILADHAFLCGLLWSFGKVVAISCIERLIGAMPNIGVHSQSEWFALVDSCEGKLAALIAAKWELPSLVRGVLRSRDGALEEIEEPDVAAMAALIYASEGIAILADEGVSVSEADLESLGGLLPDEISWILQQLPSIPERVWSMAPGDTVKPVASKVLVPASTLSPPIIPVKLEALQRRSGRETEFTCIALAKDGFVVEGRGTMQQNFVTRFELKTADGPFDLFGNVTHLHAERGRVRAEIKLLALSGTHRVRWDSLLSSTVAAIGAAESKVATPASADREVMDLAPARASTQDLVPKRPGASKPVMPMPPVAAEAGASAAGMRLPEASAEPMADPFASFMSTPGRTIVAPREPERNSKLAMWLGGVVAILMALVLLKLAL